MKRVWLLTMLCGMTAWGADATRQRFVMMESKSPTPGLYKFDTDTGRTWRLEPRDGKTMWVEITDAAPERKLTPEEQRQAKERLERNGIQMEPNGAR